MQFGMFSSASVAKPWTDGKEVRVFHEDLEMAITADRIGVEYFWAPEHHFLEEYSHCSASDTFLTAVGMRTERIRLVTGIMNLCPPINHPVRVAERIAMMDILTKGRVELGTGRGSGSLEVNGFGVTNDISRDMWDEAITVIPKMWQSESFSWEGKYFSMPERNVLPKPYQKPHPPLWVTGSNPPTAAIAGRKGIGLAMFSFGSPTVLEAPIQAYREAIEHCEPVGAFVNNQCMAITGFLCLEDGDEAREIYRQNMTDRLPYFMNYFDTVVPRPEVADGPVSQSVYRQWVEETKANKELVQGFLSLDPEKMTADDLIERGTCVGSPEEVIEAIKRFEAIGLDQLVFVPRLGYSEPFEKTLESIELLGSEILPHFRAPEPRRR